MASTDYVMASTEAVCSAPAAASPEPQNPPHSPMVARSVQLSDCQTPLWSGEAERERVAAPARSARGTA
eukprot:442566-Rhodomonas_salina.7